MHFNWLCGTSFVHAFAIRINKNAMLRSAGFDRLKIMRMSSYAIELCIIVGSRCVFDI